MGRHGPLTSLALGRSPYDEVVQAEGEGEGEGGSGQLWDERGRPWNPVSRRINKDVIRSHNEVMLVIGVAEQENGLSLSQIEASRKRDRYEESRGRMLNGIAQHLELFGIYGVNGLRQRIMIYKHYSEIPFHQLFRYHRMNQSISSYFLTGLPSWLFNLGIERAQWFLVKRGIHKPGLLQIPVNYLRLHLIIFAFMQRAGLISPASFLPNWRFFIPGSALSPITVPQLPTSFTPRSTLDWLAGLALGVAPVVGLYCVARGTATIKTIFASKIYRKLPTPDNRRRSGPASGTPLLRSGGGRGVSVGPAEAHDASRRDTGPINPGIVTSPEENLRAAMATVAAGPGPIGASTAPASPVVAFSHPGGSDEDEFGSDDEETEVVSATLISFDVEATEASDAPPGWCAELRPNGVEGCGTAAPASQEPMYRENALTVLPAALAARALAFMPTYLLMERVESAAWCGLVRSLLGRWGAPLDAIQQVGVFSARGFTNLLGVDLLFFFVQVDTWAVISMAVKRYMMEYEEEEEEEEEAKNGTAPSQA